MSRWIRPAGLGFCLVLVCAAAGRERPTPLPAKQPPELKRLRVLLVFDTDSNLQKQLEIDKFNLVGLFRQNVPASRLSLTVLEGDKARRGEILRYYRTLETGPDEALLCFYGGHGATDPEKGHYLALQEATAGEELYRSDLRRAMRARQAGLVVLLTDCCSTPVRRRPVPGTDLSPKSKDDEVELHPLFRRLFFQARGLVDVNAATDEASWGDSLNGGLFTNVLTRLLFSSRDPERDRLATWPAFFARLRDETESSFVSWAGQMRSQGEKVEARTQTPYAWFLGADAPVDNRRRYYAAVRLTNLRGNPVTYYHRWQGEAGWRRGNLTPNEAVLHSLPLAGPTEEAPVLEVRFRQGNTAEHRLRPRRFEGDRAPGSADAAGYRINAPPPASSPAAPTSPASPPD